MSRIACGFPSTRPLARRIACAISMGHYQRDLVLIGESQPDLAEFAEVGADLVAGLGVDELTCPPRLVTQHESPGC